MMAVGLVYFVFAPSMLTTPCAGAVVRQVGVPFAFMAGMIVALAGLPLLLLGRFEPVLAGLAMVGTGTFFAQAIVTGFVGRAAATDRASASGIYLACYYVGGVAGSAIPGVLFQQLGWPACVAATAAALAIAAFLGSSLRLTEPMPVAAP